MAGKSQQLATHRIWDHDDMAKKYDSRSFSDPRMQHREGRKGSYPRVAGSNETKWISWIKTDEFKSNPPDDQQRTNNVSAIERGEENFMN